MEYQPVSDIEDVQGDGWYRELGFRWVRKVVGLEGMKSAIFIYFIDFLYLYPGGHFDFESFKSILDQMSNDQNILKYFLQLVEWVSAMIIQDKVYSILDYLKIPQNQLDFCSYINSFSALRCINIANDLELFKFISASLRLSIFVYHSQLNLQLYYRPASPGFSLFIHISSPGNYSILYPPDLSTFEFFIKKFDFASDGNTFQKAPTIKLLNRTCQLCSKPYKSYIFPCSCIICHICIEDHFFIKSYFNCPKCRNKQSVQERTETLHFIKSLQRTLKPYKSQ